MLNEPGVRTQAFNVGKMRRKRAGSLDDSEKEPDSKPQDRSSAAFFDPNNTAATDLREQLARQVGALVLVDVVTMSPL